MSAIDSESDHEYYGSNDSGEEIEEASGRI